MQCAMISIFVKHPYIIHPIMKQNRNNCNGSQCRVRCALTHGESPGISALIVTSGPTLGPPRLAESLTPPVRGWGRGRLFIGRGRRVVGNVRGRPHRIDQIAGRQGNPGQRTSMGAVGTGLAAVTLTFTFPIIFRVPDPWVWLINDYLWGRKT